MSDACVGRREERLVDELPHNDSIHCRRPGAALARGRAWCRADAAAHPTPRRQEAQRRQRSRPASAASQKLRSPPRRVVCHRRPRRTRPGAGPAVARSGRAAAAARRRQIGGAFLRIHPAQLLALALSHPHSCCPSAAPPRRHAQRCRGARPHPAHWSDGVRRNKSGPSTRELSAAARRRRHHL